VTRVEHSHRFSTPLQAGFAFITDIANWPAYWPGLVRVEPGSRWAAPGDTATLVIRLLGREVELALTLSQLEPNRLVTYTSVQQGLPDARHERHFAAAADGFDYRLVVDYEPRPGLRGLFDRLIVRRAVAGAMRRTVENLERELPAES
jgi:Polyketide cyclase / dehydrase and lipid transport